MSTGGFGDIDEGASEQLRALAQSVREAILAADYKGLRDTAAATGLNPNTIRSTVNALNVPTEATLKKLLAGVGVTYDTKWLAMLEAARDVRDDQVVERRQAAGWGRNAARKGAHAVPDTAPEPAPERDVAPASGPGTFSVGPRTAPPRVVRSQEDLIARLVEDLAAGDDSPRILHGFGGCGKTTIARSLARRAEEMDCQVFWIDVATPDHIVTGMREVARALETPEPDIDSAWRGDTSATDLVWSRLDTASRPWLLVFDGADDPSWLAAPGGLVGDGNGWIRSSATGLTVVTSRIGGRDVWGDAAECYSVGVLAAAHGAGGLVWNRARSSGDSLGAIGRAAVAEVMGGLGEHRELSRYAARPGRLRAELDALPAGLHVDRARRVTEILQATDLTVEFLRHRLPGALGPGQLREALSAVANWRGRRRPMRGAPSLATEVDFVEFLAFEDATGAEPYQVGLARFVMALADGASVGPQDPALLAWAAGIGALGEVNAAAEVVRETRERRRTRLLVGLRGAGGEGEWPESVDAWLLRDRTLVGRTRLLAAGPPDQRSVERLVSEAVDWAEEHPAAGGLLERIDIAAPAWVLLAWRPEEVRHVRLLGLDYDIVPRWSDLLGPAAPDVPAVPDVRDVPDVPECAAPPAIAPSAAAVLAPGADRAAGRLRRHKQRLLADLVAARHAVGALGWLTASQMADPEAVERGLVDGSYGLAIGLTEHPGDRVRVFEALLAYSPAVIWPLPDRDGTRPAASAEDLADAVAARWLLLPSAFRQAHRQTSDPLAMLRAVWDDEEWLDFCQNFDMPFSLEVMP